MLNKHKLEEYIKMESNQKARDNAKQTQIGGIYKNGK